MKEIPKKNYCILMCLVFLTVIFTLIFVNIYNNREKPVSKFFEYSNSISSNSFDQYVLESSDLIIYIADKYNLEFSGFEEKFMKKIDELNLKNKLIYIDKVELNKKFLDKLDNEYNTKINVEKLPIIIVIENKKVIDTSYVTVESSASDIIDYGVFE